MIVRDQVEELLLLQRVAQRIATLLDLDVLLEEIVGDVAETFGYSRSAVLLKDPNEKELVIAAVRGWTANYHRKGERFRIGEYGMVGHVGLTGETYYAPNVLVDPYYQVSEPLTRSELDIPLKARGRLIGIFDVQHTEVNAFSPARIRLLEALAGHVATAIDNAQLFLQERQEKQRMIAELNEAQAIQQALLPEAAPTVAGISLSGVCIPCRTVAGDWYDYIPLPDGRLAVVVADVAGKGMAAALLMSSTRSILRMLAQNLAEPGAVLRQLNEILISDFPRSRFVTLLYVLVDPRRRTATLANAGHPAPLLKARGELRFADVENGLPIGIAPGNYPEQTISLEEDTKIVLYSDGVIEAGNVAGEEYGAEGIQRYYDSSEDDEAEGLLRDVHRFAAGTPLGDDATAVVIRTR